MTFVLYLFISLFVLVCLFLMLLILIQKGRGGGLASAFGGAGGNTAFGSKTGDVLTWATSVVFGVFLLLAIVLNLVSNANSASASAEPTTQPAPTSDPQPYVPDPIASPTAPQGGLPSEQPAQQATPPSPVETAPVELTPATAPAP